MSTDIVQNLSTEESLDLMSAKTFGRLVGHIKDDIELFPLNYVVHDGKIYLRTAEGTKLFTVTLNDEVLFEADDVNHETGLAWSVIIKGTARVLKDADEILEAEDYGLKPWLPTLKYNFVEITPREVSGRKFHLGEEPERYV